MLVQFLANLAGQLWEGAGVPAAADGLLLLPAAAGHPEPGLDYGLQRLEWRAAAVPGAGAAVLLAVGLAGYRMAL